MNNSAITLEEVVVIDEHLRAKEAELVKVIEALASIESSQEWSILKMYVFDRDLASLEKQLMSESHKDELASPRIYRLQGQIKSAKKYALTHLLETSRLELINLRRQLTQPTER